MSENNGVKELTTEHLAMEILKQEQEKSRAKDRGNIFSFIVSVLLIALLAYSYTYFTDKFCQNDKEWRELFGSYDYVSQDGNGQNYYNSDIGGDVNNGTKSKEANK